MYNFLIKFRHSAVKYDHGVQSLLQIHTAYLSLMLVLNAWIVDSHKSVATAGHYKFLGFGAIKAWDELGLHVSDASFSTGHFPDHFVVLSSVEQNWVSFLSDNIYVIWVKL